MKSWKNYQNLFAELSSLSDGIRLELRFGEGEEDWFVDVGDESRRTEFLKICTSAGESLPQIHLSDHETGSTIAPEVRWFRLLRERNFPGVSTPILIDKAGVALSEWSLEEAACRSADLCDELQRGSPIQASSNNFRNAFRRDPIGISLKISGALVLGFVLYRLMSG